MTERIVAIALPLCMGMAAASGVLLGFGAYKQPNYLWAPAFRDAGVLFVVAAVLSAAVVQPFCAKLASRWPLAIVVCGLVFLVAARLYFLLCIFLAGV